MSITFFLKLNKIATIEFFFSHNTRTTQWQDPRTDFISATLSQNNLFSSSSENSSVETIFSSPVILGPSSQNRKIFFFTKII